MEETTSRENGFWATARPILIKWERLRLFYNLLLLLMVVAIGFSDTSMISKFYIQWDPFIILKLFGYAVGSNILFFVAPALESYAAWLGFRSRWLSVGLFVGGALISFPIVLRCLEEACRHGLFHGFG